MASYHLTSFAINHSPEEPPIKPLFQATESSAFSMTIIKEENSHLSKRPSKSSMSETKPSCITF